jgi:hypothetical protein
MKTFVKVLCLAAASAAPLFAQTVDPCSYTTQLTGGTTVEVTTDWQKTGSVPGTSYEYILWHNKNTSSNKVSMKYYGANQGGGAAFRGEWNETNTNFDYLARIGYQFDEGKLYTDYDNIYADYSYTRSARLSGKNYSYIGIYGWARSGNGAKLVEYYIVDDWWGNEYQADNSPVGNGTICESKCDAISPDVTIDGGTYKIYKNSRTNEPSIEGDNSNFDQYFSVRQTPRKCGTISITEHFKAWDKKDLKMGPLYEAKILAEVGAYNPSNTTGWIDYRYATMRMGNASTPSSSSVASSSSKASSSSVASSSSSSNPPTACGYQTSFCGGMAFANISNATSVPSTGACVYIGNFEVIQPNLNSTISINGTENTCGADWDNSSYNTKPSTIDGGYYVYVKTGTVNSHENNGWKGIVAKAKPNCTSFGTPSSSSGAASSSSKASSSSGAVSSSSAGTSSSSSNVTTPILDSEFSILNSQSSIQYYTLKGNPLGNKKPSKPGVYIVKEDRSIKKIVVR